MQSITSLAASPTAAKWFTWEHLFDIETELLVKLIAATEEMLPWILIKGPRGVISIEHTLTPVFAKLCDSAGKWQDAYRHANAFARMIESYFFPEPKPNFEMRFLELVEAIKDKHPYAFAVIGLADIIKAQQAHSTWCIFGMELVTSIMYQQTIEELVRRARQSDCQLGNGIRRSIGNHEVGRTVR